MIPTANKQTISFRIISLSDNVKPVQCSSTHATKTHSKFAGTLSQHRGRLELLFRRSDLETTVSAAAVISKS